MKTWILFVYLSTGFGSASTGGPTAIDGFKSKLNCETAALQSKDIPKFDWAYCLEVTK